MNMADIATSATTSTDNIVPAWRLEAKRKERAERIRVATSTIIAQAIEGARTRKAT